MSVFSNLVGAFKIGSTPVVPTVPIMDLEKSERVSESKAIVEDPLSLVQALQYKNKPYSLSYDTLNKMASRNSVIASIISTRVNQVSSFTKPARYTKDGIGFEISMRNPKAKPSKEQEQLMLSIEGFIDNCGYQYNPSRDDFDTFIRKIMRDSLIYDQLCFEIVPDRMGRPAEMYAVDASTIRAAITEPIGDKTYVTSTDMLATDKIQWVQLIDGVVASEFTGYELAFAVRNPRTDINIQPYGYSELEVLVHQVTAHLWAEEYNTRYFSQGGTTKGILNLKGQNISKEQLEAFRRQWTAQIAGMTGAWKTPVVSVDGLEYINVSQSNREMEYEMWMNYLINICSAVYQIDPAEINFPNRGGSGGGSGGGIGDGGIEDKLKNSKDKGLRPLLRFIESIMNRYVIRRFSNDFSFNFTGLNPESEGEKQGTMDKQIRTYKTINEVRKEHDLEPIDGGDIVLDATYTNYLLQKQQADAMAQQEQGQDPNAPVDPNAPPVEGGDEPVQYEGQEEGDQPSAEDIQKQQEDDQISQSIDENL